MWLLLLLDDPEEELSRAAVTAGSFDDAVAFGLAFESVLGVRAREEVEGSGRGAGSGGCVARSIELMVARGDPAAAVTAVVAVAAVEGLSAAALASGCCMWKSKRELLSLVRLRMAAAAATAARGEQVEEAGAGVATPPDAATVCARSSICLGDIAAAALVAVAGCAAVSDEVAAPTVNALLDHRPLPTGGRSSAPLVEEDDSSVSRGDAAGAPPPPPLLRALVLARRADTWGRPRGLAAGEAAAAEEEGEEEDADNAATAAAPAVCATVVSGAGGGCSVLPCAVALLRCAASCCSSYDELARRDMKRVDRMQRSRRGALRLRAHTPRSLGDSSEEQ